MVETRLKLTEAEQDSATVRELAEGAMLYKASADAVDTIFGMAPAYEKVAPFPVMQNLGQAIELALKSWLKENGTDYEHRRGHNLISLLNRAKKQCPNTFGKVDEAPIVLLNEFYATQVLRYGGGKMHRSVPHFGPLQKAAKVILDACRVPDPETYSWEGG